MDLSSLTGADRKAAEAIVTRCIVDRLFFVEHVLNLTVEEWQKEAIASLDGGETRISIRSAVGVGKTSFVAWMALHFLLFRDDVKVVALSPSFSQLTDGMIPEVKKWIARLPDWLRSQLTATSDRITVAPENANNFISFRTARADVPEALQGIHAAHVLVLVDEASAVHENVFDAGAGAMSTDGAITVLISNPTRTSGLFYRTQTKLKHLWKTFVVNAMQSTQVATDFIKNMQDTYGEDSQQYKIRVLAQFPDGNADSVIPRAWIEAAVGRDIMPMRRKKIWGLDPGRGGDPSGFCEVTGGNTISFLEELRYENLMSVVGHVKERWDSIEKEEDYPEFIFVDVIGLGAGVFDRLEELGLPVVAINVAEVAAVSARFVRLRSELWHKGRLFFEQATAVIVPTIGEAIKSKFIDELSETAFKPHSSGKLDVESKRDLKARGSKSPNLADAFLLTLAGDGAMTNGSISGSSSNKPLNYSYSGMV